MTDLTASVAAPPISWMREDIEQGFGFRGARFTQVNNWLTLLLGTAATVLFYVALLPFPKAFLATTFTQRGPTPYFIALFSFWSLAILLVKWRKLALQRRVLRYDVVPAAHDFVLSASTVDQVIDGIYAVVDDSRNFVLYNRIMIALSNLKNLGRVTEVDEILRSQADDDGSLVETSYSLVRGFVWAIPVLGFIGTVLGLSEAIGGFGTVLQATTDVSNLVDSLKIVTSGLATAFETTLQALVAALAIQILLTFLKKQEEEFLDACSEYCRRQVVNRLRVMPFHQE